VLLNDACTLFDETRDQRGGVDKRNVVDADHAQ